MFQSPLKFGLELLPALRQLLGKPAFQQSLPALSPLDPLPGLVQREPACPGRKRLRWVIRIELFPKRQRSLLNDILRIAHVRHQRRHIPEYLPLAAEKQRQELLLPRGLIVRILV